MGLLDLAEPPFFFAFQTTPISAWLKNLHEAEAPAVPEVKTRQREKPVHRRSHLSSSELNRRLHTTRPVAPNLD